MQLLRRRRRPRLPPPLPRRHGVCPHLYCLCRRRRRRRRRPLRRRHPLKTRTKTMTMKMITFVSLRGFRPFHDVVVGTTTQVARRWGTI